MSKDNGDRLELKKTSTKRVASVRLTSDVAFFGIHGGQLSSTMEGINLEWNGELLVVTSSNYPGEEKWIFPAHIAYISWKTS